MGIYKVNPDGHAPSGLAVGDFVVTGGGTYLIVGFNSDGSYKSRKVDAATNTYNYTGNYDTAGSTVKSSAADTQIKNGGSWEDLVSTFLQELESTASRSYQPAQIRTAETISFEDAMKLAQEAMQPQYAAAYEQSAKSARQNLEKAGLYDTVYGQALAAEAQRDVTRDLNAAIVSLALELSDASQEQAQQVLELAVKERQFGADYDAQQKNTALKYLMSLVS